MSLQSNPAIVLFGAQNDKNQSVSKELSDMGLMMLRIAPSALQFTVVKDQNQPHYAFYLGNLSAYLKSWIENSKVKANATGFPCLIPLSISIPLTPPAMALGWRIPIAEEVKDSIIKDHGATPILVTGGKAGLSVQKDTFAGYSNLRSFKPDPTFPAPDGHMNLSCLVPAATSLRLLSAVALLQHYPAFCDSDHTFNFNKECYDEKDTGESRLSMGEISLLIEQLIEDVNMAGEEEGEVILAPRKTRGYIRAKGVKMPFSENLAVGLPIDEIPNASGLFFPFFSPLALWDEKAVPKFINRYLLLSLGDQSIEINEFMESIRSCWGVLCKSEWGKEMAHFATVMDMALLAQAQCIPIIQESRYIGCVLSGEGFSIHLRDRCWRPVSYADLSSAVKLADTHARALGVIANKIHRSQTEANSFINRVKTMARLREELLNTPIRETDTAEIVKLAHQLSFPGHKSWSINVNTLTKAFDTIINTSISLDGYPIHASQIFEQNRSHVVWSCFGGMAPTFLIPGGRILDLTAQLKTVVKQPTRGGGTRDVETAWSKVAVRNIILERALADLDKVLEDKKIQSPFAQASIRKSSANQDRFFSGDQAIEIIGGLRKVCRISEVSSGSGKRKAEGQVEDVPSGSRMKYFDL
jgi:hypothetical protein